MESFRQLYGMARTGFRPGVIVSGRKMQGGMEDMV